MIPGASLDVSSFESGIPRRSRRWTGGRNSRSWATLLRAFLVLSFFLLVAKITIATDVRIVSIDVSTPIVAVGDIVDINIYKVETTVPQNVRVLATIDAPNFNVLTNRAKLTVIVYDIIFRTPVNDAIVFARSKEHPEYSFPLYVVEGNIYTANLTKTSYDIIVNNQIVKSLLLNEDRTITVEAFSSISLAVIYLLIVISFVLSIIIIRKEEGLISDLARIPFFFGFFGIILFPITMWSPPKDALELSGLVVASALIAIFFSSITALLVSGGDRGLAIVIGIFGFGVLFLAYLRDPFVLKSLMPFVPFDVLGLVGISVLVGILAFIFAHFIEAILSSDGEEYGKEGEGYFVAFVGILSFFLSLLVFQVSPLGVTVFLGIFVLFASFLVFEVSALALGREWDWIRRLGDWMRQLGREKTEYYEWYVLELARRYVVLTPEVVAYELRIPMKKASKVLKRFVKYGSAERRKMGSVVFYVFPGVLMQLSPLARRIIKVLLENPRGVSFPELLRIAGPMGLRAALEELKSQGVVVESGGVYRLRGLSPVRSGEG